MKFKKFKLNILWLENELGVALIKYKGEKIPLTNYFFWPQNDTWEQIRND